MLYKPQNVVIYYFFRLVKFKNKIISETIVFIYQRLYIFCATFEHTV